MPTPEFEQMADYALGEIIASRPEEEQAFIKQAEYLLEYRPLPWQLTATNTPNGYRLLGMYMKEPSPHITIFEEGLRAMAGKFGSLYNAIKSTWEHEIFQHHYGLDHTLETEAAGFIPAFIVPSNYAPEVSTLGEPHYA